MPLYHRHGDPGQDPIGAAGQRRLTETDPPPSLAEALQLNVRVLD
jgi:hypothetical protein